MDEYPSHDQLLSRAGGKLPDPVTYDSETDTYRANVGSNESVSMAVISTVMAVSETDPRKSERLYEAIDPDALDDLVSRANGNDFRIAFEYAGYRVVVEGTGRIVVAEADD